MKILDAKQAKKLAHRFCPVVVQEWKRLEDFPSVLNFDSEERMRKNLVFGMREPALYYRMSEDAFYYYAFYMVFHAFDWSDSKFAIIRKLDSHVYDTEGLCFRISKVTGNCDLATIFHHDIKVQANSGPMVWIDAEGHGIRPYRQEYISDHAYSVYPPKAFNLYNLDSLTKSTYDRITKLLNDGGVDAPHQQSEDGILFTAPHTFFSNEIGD